MNDRELLELAAKAAGYEYAKHGGYIVIDGIPGNWNPLENDGDALRLAVKLKMMIDYVSRGYKAEHIAAVSDATSCYEPIQPDPYAATRCAIVRAAAEIGRAM